MKRNNSLKKLILCALFCALICVGGFLKIAVPPVPLSLQSFFVLLAGLALGPAWGAASVGVYLLLGLAGLPVFALGGGFAYILKPTFGYLIGMVLCAALTGFLWRRAKKKTYLSALAACLAGSGAVYLVGLPYLYGAVTLLAGGAAPDFLPLLASGFLLTLPGDVAKCLVSAAIVLRLPGGGNEKI